MLLTAKPSVQAQYQSPKEARQSYTHSNTHATVTISQYPYLCNHTFIDDIKILELRQLQESLNSTLPPNPVSIDPLLRQVGPLVLL